VASANSVTAWIAGLKAGKDEAAARQLWERYFHRLVGLAKSKLAKSRPGIDSPEDVALSAFGSFFRGVGRGRFPQLQDRNNLWPLLVVITSRKSMDVIKHNQSLKEGGGKIRGESAVALSREAGANEVSFDHIIGREPQPDFVIEVAEEYERLLAKLGDETLRQIAVLKLEGYKDTEVAGKLNCGLRTVERKMERIRSILQKELGR
jgi:DNA-directed RNA polymerase specialized sigma24 family protein